MGGNGVEGSKRGLPLTLELHFYYYPFIGQKLGSESFFCTGVRFEKFHKTTRREFGNPSFRVEISENES